MVRQCFKCKKLDFLNPNLTFHRFPRDPDKRKMWINILSLETQGVPKVCVICSDHFDESDFIYNARGVCVLKDDNVLPKYDSSQDQLIESGVKTEEIKIENSETVKNIESVGDLNILDNCTIKNEISEDCTITKNTMVNEHKEIKEENESYHDQPDLVHVKFENSETTNEVEKMDESALDEIAIKNEEVLLKEEGEEAAKSSTSSTYLDTRKKEKNGNIQSELMQFRKNECGEYQCSDCDYKTKRNNKVVQHFGYKYSEEHDVFTCNECFYVTNNKSAIERHILLNKNHNDASLCKCHICDFETSKNGDLIEHFLHQHQEVEVYQCNKCDYQTNHKFLLKAHILGPKSIHGVTRYKCYHCTFESNYKSNLKLHVLRHKTPHIVSMFKCEVCFFKARFKSDLKEHFIKKHLKQDIVYKCNKCNYQTIYKSNWKSHLVCHKS